MINEPTPVIKNISIDNDNEQSIHVHTEILDIGEKDKTVEEHKYTRKP